MTRPGARAAPHCGQDHIPGASHTPTHQAEAHLLLRLPLCSASPHPMGTPAIPLGFSPEPPSLHLLPNNPWLRLCSEGPCHMPKAAVKACHPPACQGYCSIQDRTLGPGQTDHWALPGVQLFTQVAGDTILPAQCPCETSSQLLTVTTCLRGCEYSPLSDQESQPPLQPPFFKTGTFTSLFNAISLLNPTSWTTLSCRS